MKQELFYNEKKHEAFKLGIKAVHEILEDAIRELKSNGVRGYTCEKLKGGKFIEIFQAYHKKQQAKNSITRSMLFDKYLELYGYNTEKLEILQQQYNSRLSRQYTFYSFNDEFYDYCKNGSFRDSALKLLHDKAPNIKTYGVFDFLSVKENSFNIDVPKELFTLYATNSRQLKIIDKVKSFVRLSKELELDYNDVLKPLEKYLDHASNPMAGFNKVGLSRDLSQVNFDYNKILTIK